MLKTGVIGTSLKENEHRVPVHPSHFQRIPPNVRNHITFETGYAEHFGIDDDTIARLGYELASRDELLEHSQAVILPKPTDDDLQRMADGIVLWGWPHCVQQASLTEIAIQKRLTLIAFEAMYDWSPSGARGSHSFYRNNELAGYCAALHALQLTGLDGYYGPHTKAVILSFGSVSRGAAYALHGRGFTEMSIFTQRPPHVVRDKLIYGRFGQMMRGPSPDQPLLARFPGETPRPMCDEFAAADIIVNGILQDTDNPLMYMCDSDIERFKPHSVIIDVSCDADMGFPFAKPTTFETPVFRTGNATYYAVDHTPTYLWNAASWEISQALLPYMDVVMNGPDAWPASPTIAKAIEIRDGAIQNPKILTFQHREPAYPHAVRPGA